MNGIYEIFQPRNGKMRIRFHCAFDIGDLRLQTEGVQRAEPVTSEPTLTSSPAINLDGSDMVRMSWPEADDVVGWILERGIRPRNPPEDRRGDRDYLSRIARDLKCDWRAIQDHGIIFDESTPRSGRIEWPEHATRFQNITTIPDVIG